MVDTEGTEIVNYKLIKEEVEKIEGLKSEIFNNFYKNLLEVEELTNYLKRSKLTSVKESVDTLKEQLITIKEDFELSLDSIINLEKEETEFLTEIKDFKAKAKTKSAETISDDELHKIYEKENPRKKALWRGKETKGFIEWKKKYLVNVNKIKG